jgi:wyosine [tRNA(Phe)-imidazoG37] synthetase (radical SAM superfamily)
LYLCYLISNRLSTFLFDRIIFGPVWSRRLGESLGVNLLPVNRKVCNFSCIYCECGLTPAENDDSGFPPAYKVRELLISQLKKMNESGEYLDCITFAGNGEPTLHPEFSRIIEETIEIRNNIFPKVKIAVLSNATRINIKEVFSSLLKVDLNILKFDSAIEKTLIRINCPRAGFKLSETIGWLTSFNGKLIIQTLFFKGIHKGNTIDNTSEYEVNAWLRALYKIKPQCVMIYSIARDTPVTGLKSINQEMLNKIAKRVEKIGISAQVTP